MEIPYILTILFTVVVMVMAAAVRTRIGSLQSKVDSLESRFQEMIRAIEFAERQEEGSRESNRTSAEVGATAPARRTARSD